LFLLPLLNSFLPLILWIALSCPQSNCVLSFFYYSSTCSWRRFPPPKAVFLSGKSVFFPGTPSFLFLHFSSILSPLLLFPFLFQSLSFLILRFSPLPPWMEHPKIPQTKRGLLPSVDSEKRGFPFSNENLLSFFSFPPSSVPFFLQTTRTVKQIAFSSSPTFFRMADYLSLLTPIIFLSIPWWSVLPADWYPLLLSAPPRSLQTLCHSIKAIGILFSSPSSSYQWVFPFAFSTHTSASSYIRFIFFFIPLIDGRHYPASFRSSQLLNGLARAAIPPPSSVRSAARRFDTLISVRLALMLVHSNPSFSPMLLLRWLLTPH